VQNLLVISLHVHLVSKDYKEMVAVAPFAVRYTYSTCPPNQLPTRLPTTQAFTLV